MFSSLTLLCNLFLGLVLFWLVAQSFPTFNSLASLKTCSIGLDKGRRRGPAIFISASPLVTTPFLKFTPKDSPNPFRSRSPQLSIEASLHWNSLITMHGVDPFRVESSYLKISETLRLLVLTGSNLAPTSPPFPATVSTTPIFNLSSRSRRSGTTSCTTICKTLTEMGCSIGMGLFLPGPISYLSCSKFGVTGLVPLTINPRSVSFSPLFNLHLLFSSYVAENGRRLHSHIVEKIIVRINKYLCLTLVEDSVSVFERFSTTHDFTSLKKNGIMIPSPTSGDYHVFFKTLSSLPLINALKPVLNNNLQAIIYVTRNVPRLLSLPHLSSRLQALCEILNLHGQKGLHVREDPPALLRLFTLQIMAIGISPKSLKTHGDLPPHSNCQILDHGLEGCSANNLFLTILASVFIYHPTFVPSSSLAFVPANHEAKDSFSKLHESLRIVTILNLLELLAEVSMTHHKIACGMLLECFCLRFSMGYPIFLPTFVASFYSLKFIVPCFMLRDFVIFALWELIE